MIKTQYLVATPSIPNSLFEICKQIILLKSGDQTQYNYVQQQHVQQQQQQQRQQQQQQQQQQRKQQQQYPRYPEQEIQSLQQIGIQRGVLTPQHTIGHPVDQGNPGNRVDEDHFGNQEEYYGHPEHPGHMDHSGHTVHTGHPGHPGHPGEQSTAPAGPPVLPAGEQRRLLM